MQSSIKPLVNCGPSAIEISFYKQPILKLSLKDIYCLISSYSANFVIINNTYIS